MSCSIRQSLTTESRSIPMDQMNSCHVEMKQRLSRSILWQWQRAFFECQGIEAWSQGTVPHHITSSPFIADAYARVVAAYLRDCHVAESNPVYIVELGSGPGRFAYLFLKKLLSIHEQSVSKNIPIRYVMTDFTERTVAYWRAQPWLQPFVESGVLDFARFDVEHDQTLTLLNEGKTLSAKTVGYPRKGAKTQRRTALDSAPLRLCEETCKSPIVVIANYVFDSIPQDAFVAADGNLFETLVTLSTSETESDLSNPEILSRVKFSYDHNLVNGNYYADRDWNRILIDYKRRLSGVPFLFPTVALKCVRNFHRLSKGKMLLLSGDRGYCSDQALLDERGAPNLAVHGSISMMVDYQIIGEYCRRLGADVLHPSRVANSLNISAFIFGDPSNHFLETRAAYAEAIEKFGPDDFFELKEGISQLYDALSLDQILAFLRLSCWDYKRFVECLPALKKHLTDITGLQKQQLHDAIVKVWDSYLPIGEESDLAFELGTLLLEMELHAEALEFLQRSVDVCGIAPGTAYNIAVCHYGLGQTDRALDYVNQALGLDHEFAEAEHLRKELESALSTEDNAEQLYELALPEKYSSRM